MKTTYPINCNEFSLILKKDSIITILSGELMIKTDPYGKISEAIEIVSNDLIKIIKDCVVVMKSLDGAIVGIEEPETLEDRNICEFIAYEEVGISVELPTYLL